MRQGRKCDLFFNKMDRLGLALSFNDVRLKTAYSEILPAEANTVTRFSRNIPLRIPIVSAAMDTVTEAAMAIEMAKLGGLGIVHKSLTVKEQADVVRRVKFDLNGFIPNPVCVCASDTVAEIQALRRNKGYKFMSFMVKDENGQIIGIVTHNDFDFCSDDQREIRSIMSSNMISAEIGVSIEEAYGMMMEKRVKILPVFATGELKGIYTLSDLRRILSGNLEGYNVDPSGSLRVGAAIGIGPDTYNRIELLASSRVDVLVIDTAHGNSKGVVEMIRYCKSNYPAIDIVAGNVSEGEAAKRLVDAGADGIKVGQGPGSICTTRMVAGIGQPQVTAIHSCEKAIRGSGVPICADGGVENPGDITIAIAAGGSSVMIGKLLAGTNESPGEVIYKEGRQMKVYRGMGSLEAMIENKASRERYGQGETSTDKLVPEGVKSLIDYKGEVNKIIFQLVGGLSAGMGYVGAHTVKELQSDADFHRISAAGLAESKPHGLDHIQNHQKQMN